MTGDFAGRSAVVTGGGRGIGRATALAFAKAGADVAICARSDKALQEVKVEIESMGRRCITAALDIVDPGAVRGFCTSIIQTFGKVDVLVNNAGVYLDQGKFADSDPEAWWKTVEVNIRGPYMFIRHLLDAMPEGGSIINLSSGKGFSPGQNSAAYHVSKAGLNMLTEGLANEVWDRGITVNTLVPGPTATTTLSRQDPNSGVTTDDILKKFTDEPPAGLPAWERVKHPDEVARLALQIAGYGVGGPTGQVFSLARRPL